MGKARGQSDQNDLFKATLDQNRDNYGLGRTNYQGTGQERGSTTGVASIDQNVRFKLDTRGGIMKGALGRKGIVSAELTADGIIDMTIYHIPRLYITNTALNTLKVIIPSMGDGQEVWIRANGGVSFTIQNTTGTGNETTGNIELMAGADYTMTGDDWIGFHYDATDSKFHQVTAGKQNIGGAGAGDNLGDHTATQDLQMVTHDIDWGTSASIRLNGVQLDIYGGLSKGMTIGSSLNESHAIFRPIANGTLTLGSSSRFWSTLYTVDAQLAGTIHMNDNNVDGVDILYFWNGSSPTVGSINQNGVGHMEYSEGLGTKEHRFFVGSERFRISSVDMTCFNPMDMNGNNVNGVAQLIFDSTGTIGGSTVGWSSLTGDMYGNVQSGDSYFLRVNGTTEVEIDADGVDIRNGWLEMEERVTPTGLTNHIRLYGKDNGSGKTQLVVIFGSGAEQVIATQP